MIEWLEHFRLKNETPKISAVDRIPLNTGGRTLEKGGDPAPLHISRETYYF